MAEITKDQKIARYRDEVLPSMHIDDLMNQFEQAIRTDDGYGSNADVLQMIRAEVRKRVA